MNRKRMLCLAVCLAFAAALPARAQSDEYRDAVTRMMEVTGTMKTTDTMLIQMVGYLKDADSTVPEEYWTKMVSKFKEKLRTRMVDICVTIYRKYLTLEDLNELNAVYSMPIMQKLVEVNPAILQESMTAGAEIGQEVLAELLQELQTGEMDLKTE